MNLNFSIQRLPRSLLQFLALVIFLGFLTACESQVVLYEKLSEQEANEIYSALLNKGLPARKMANKEGYSVTVPQGYSGKSLEVLRDEGLPKTRTDSLGQVFKKENMISSPLEERARYLYALSQELEKTLLTIDGVISARVHVVLPEQPAPGRPLMPSSAAVFIKYRSDTDFGMYVGRVRQLVFNSIPGLPTDSMDAVSVIALPSQSVPNSQQSLDWIFGIGVVSQSVSLLQSILGVLVLLCALGPLVTYVVVKKPDWLKSRMEKWMPSVKRS